jgi:hypothetical protein
MDKNKREVPGSFDPKDSVEGPRCGVSELAAPDLFDPVIEMYKRDVDRTLLVKNLSLTAAERAEKLVDFVDFLGELRRAGRRLPADGQ